MSFILGISGIAGSGKDTIGDYLVAYHGWDGKISFARNLKDMCKSIFELSEFQVSDHEGKKSIFKKSIKLTDAHVNMLLAWMCKTHETIGFSLEKRTEISQMILNSQGKVFTTSREILQFVGTDFCRTIIPTYHVDIVKQQALTGGNWIITDVRFPNEAEMIKDASGIIIRVERPGLVISEEVVKHASETSMLGWDWNAIIVNDVERVEDLYLKVDRFLEEHKLYAR